MENSKLKKEKQREKKNSCLDKKIMKPFNNHKMLLCLLQPNRHSDGKNIQRIDVSQMITLIIFIKICTFCHVNNLRQIKNQIIKKNKKKNKK